MSENTNKRSGHLRILICYTVIELALIGQSLNLGWDMTAVMLLFIGLVVSWMLHITGRLASDLCLWLYFILAMLAFFFYGTHETSIYDLAPTIIIIMIMMSDNKSHIFVRLSTITYFFTMIYALVFVAEDIEFNSLTVTRTIFHFALVCIADWLVGSQQQERARLQETMDDKVVELEENNHKMENFLVNVSHELRTPINAIMGFTSVILDKEKDATKRQDVLSIQKAGHRLFDQIEDILDYTEIDTGSIKINHDDYMISSVVNDIVISEQTREKENPPEIIFDVDPAIPARLVGDARKIKKIMKHLIDNAVKFTPGGAVLVEISGRKKEYGINLCIDVTDTGVGIKEENIKKLSSKFYQQNSERNRSASGLGLGLSIVYGIVSAMGGFVQIKSTDGEGTVVSVSIPQKVSDESQSISVDKPDDLCIACYLKPEKYASAKVFRFYDNMISHMVQGLNIPLHRVGSEAELERVLSKYRVTHLFTAKEEYLDRPSYYEGLCNEISVIAVTDDVNALQKNSRVIPLKKPFYFLPIIDILNKNNASHSDLFDTRRIICPGVKALIVDDEPMNLMVADEILKGYQMQVKTASSGQKAVDICLEEDFDIIFLDHMMPGMDGIETLKLLRRNDEEKKRGSRNRLTIIAFTANAVSGAREMFLSEGFDEFISKPIEMIELNRVLKKVLPRSAIKYLSEDEPLPEETAQTPETPKTEEAPSEILTDEANQKGNAAEPEDELAPLERAGIHTQPGIAYSMGDVEFYKKILTSFAEDAPLKKADMQGFLQNADWGNYQILVHALKSTAKMIGADELSGMAKASEDAAKASDGEYIIAHDDELMAKYDKTVQAISDALGLEANSSNAENTDASEEASTTDSSAEISADDFKNRLSELRDCLDTFEADRAESIISEIKSFSYDGRQIGEILSEIIDDVDNFDLSAASE